jgi:GT2 family glycosyltransferase
VSDPIVIAVVVTWNRPELFVEGLAALRAQSRPLGGIVVVDNASDVSVEPLVGDAHLVTLPENTGGAGGFTVGIAEAMRLGADYVWLMDDDTVPTPTALEELLAVARRAPESARVFGSRVVWTDGRDHPMNTPRVRPFASRASIAAAAAHDAYPVRSISFVSVMIDARAIRELGLPVAEYFLWNDDFEYTARLLRRYTGFVARKSIVVHKTKVFGSTDVDPGPRFRFEVRNKLWLLRRSSALAPIERVIYSGATLRFWARTFVKSPDRSVLRAGLAAGLREGVTSRPLPNSAALTGISGDLTDQLRSFE